MSIKNITIALLFIIIFFPTLVEGKIYVCIDSDGSRHYSDKKCPVNNNFKAEVINDLGKVALPNSVLEYTPIIQIMKRTLALATEQVPDSERYRNAYQYTLAAEKSHNKFIFKTHKKIPQDYNPFDPVKLVDIIAAISYSCRVQGYMTICGVIESNYWLNGEEQIFINKILNKETEHIITPTNKKLFCKKAKIANQGGVISRRMLGTFCQKTINNTSDVN